MTMTFKKSFRKLLFWSLTIFVCMFLLRLSYGYFATSSRQSGDYSEDFFSQEIPFFYTHKYVLFPSSFFTIF